MDRFIGLSKMIEEAGAILFKIQYGQIYSEQGKDNLINKDTFKIQYGQIYRQNYLHTLIPNKIL